MSGRGHDMQEVDSKFTSCISSILEGDREAWGRSTIYGEGLTLKMALPSSRVVFLAHTRSWSTS